MANYSDQTIADALDAISRRQYVLPAIQRDFVWRADRICALFDSLMRDYPISSLLYWQVDKEHGREYQWYDFVLNYHELESPFCPRHEGLPEEDRVAVLDGQQRLTALNVGLRGSYAARAKWQRAGKLRSYPIKQLYLDICAAPRLSEDRYEDQVYRFDFLEGERAKADNAQANGAHWFRVSDVLSYPRDPSAGQAVNAYLRDHDLGNHPSAFETLFRLWSAVFEKRHLSYFMERTQSLDRVLDIFIRVNSQGEPLSKSDLLMSVATAQWKERDAREEIPATVRHINAVSPGFGFNRDHVLKAGLVMAGVSDVGFRASTFTRDNMRRLEKAWDSISQHLYLAVELLATFGLSQNNIDAGAVLVPIAYYVQHRQLGDQYLAAASASPDRQRVRDWTIRALLMPGVFGSGLDTLLARLRRVIDDKGGAGFPSSDIEDAMAAMGKSLRFDPQTIDELANSKYGQPDTFALLSILYGHVDPAKAWHVDHVFPQAKLRRDTLRSAGYSEEQIERITTQAGDGLANLQLLPGGENIGKSERLPLQWAREQYGEGVRLQGYLEQNDMADLPEGIDGFLEFYEQRRSRMRERLVAVLGRDPGSLAER